MAKSYRVTPTVRLVNRLVRAMIRLGLPPPYTYELTVRGRKSGRSYTTPVRLLEKDGQRWLVSPYGEVSWVRNARAAGEVTLSRGRQVETLKIIELGPQESAPILKQYVTEVPIVRPYFDAQPDSPLENFVAEAPRHPVFALKQ